MYKEQGQEFHQVGMFYGHFREDVLSIIEALNNAGYDVCRTLGGDMIIMQKGEYTVDNLIEINDDDDDDDDYDNIRHFPREY